MEKPEFAEIIYHVSYAETHSESMLLLGSTIAFFDNTACYNSLSTWRTTGTPRCYVKSEKGSTNKSITEEAIQNRGYKPYKYFH